MKEVDYSKYAGEWIVVCNNRIVAHAKDLTKIQGKIRKCKTTPRITKVLEGEVLIF